MNDGRNSTSPLGSARTQQYERKITDGCFVCLTLPENIFKNQTIVIRELKTFFSGKTLRMKDRRFQVLSFIFFLVLFEGWFFTLTAAGHNEITLTFLCLGF